MVLLRIAIWLALLTAPAFAGDRRYPDHRCDGAGRYAAMRAGADCFNPPRDYVYRPGYGMQPRRWWWTMRRHS
jgi:hypothetical protein